MASVVSKVMWVGRARIHSFWLLAALAAISVGMFLLAAKPANADSFTVNSTGDRSDTNTGDGKCRTGQAVIGVGELCTLRAAIEQANATATADNINFNISGTAVHTISPLKALPPITAPVTINGYTQGRSTADTSDDAKPNRLAQGNNAVLKIELNGAKAGVGVQGLQIGASNSVVKGLVVNGFSATGIAIASGTGIKVEGNFVGTDPSGTFGRPNGSVGVSAFPFGSNSTIGGTTPEARNVISGNNNAGVFIGLQTRGNKVQGNYIGTKRDGRGSLGNFLAGVAIGGSNNIVGGATPGAANIIAFTRGNDLNPGNGIELSNAESSTRNRILSNSIFSNHGPGIDLGDNGSTPNDGGTADDSDTGPNGLQNKPSLTSAITSGGTTTTLRGVLDTKPNTTYTVQFFSQPSGNEGRTFIGHKQIPTDSDGRATFSFSPAKAVKVGQKITATATGPEGTSEFSGVREVTAS